MGIVGSILKQQAYKKSSHGNQLTASAATARTSLSNGNIRRAKGRIIP